MNQSFMENHRATRRLALEQDCMDESEIISKLGFINFDDICTYCDFYQNFYSQIENHNHDSDQQKSYTDHFINNRNKKNQFNILNFKKPVTTTLIDSSQIYNENNYCNQIYTDVHIPSSSYIPGPCTDPNKVATQSESNASSHVEHANVYSMFLYNYNDCSLSYFELLKLSI
ncbi:PREDICTED: uncharacterized protein LOC105368198 [Ceratosolen solmsi marchali]|uniref:Uncharacterized protein LOC105368198 n=1 Tax=Ceratosolen solmsi marchali TaxID=326594 RepID=A0AAJ6YW42_9HYME|nr:PREDICTED: uncharacterized protein LOC105368198 [Ceratosolen solmsi marchali]